ncbi:Protein kinase-like domain superfamily [Sesbania bispinosa]|nr:Protein kinase-like domain superfamily [Sesbania bispinosa]
MDKFLNDIDMEREKPIRFTDQQLRIATDNYSYKLGSGGFGAVYKVYGRSGNNGKNSSFQSGSALWILL